MLSNTQCKRHNVILIIKYVQGGRCKVVEFVYTADAISLKYTVITFKCFK